MKKLAILGTGMAGTGAAYRLRGEQVTTVLFDKNQFAGGHTATVPHSTGFLFDAGPHVSFTKDERIRELFAKAVADQYEAVQYCINNYWQGHWFLHPVQCNLHGLPHDLVTKILVSFIEEERKPLQVPKDYAQWLTSSYGKVLAETFPFEYTLKYHTTHPKNLTTDWMGPRMYRPSLEEMIFGAISPSTPNNHYITNFRYPTRGGFQSYVDGLRADAEVRLGHKLVRLDPVSKELSFENGTKVPYDGVISSIPLPDLLPLIAGVPADVLSAASRLACSSVVLVNIGIARTDVSPAHISYFYDRDVCFSRLSFPHMFSPNNSPPGCGSIQAEVYFSRKYRPLDKSPEACIEPVLRDLRKVGLLREDEQILHKNAAFAEYANIIFDHDRPQALATVLGYLDDIGVGHCGRFGDWAYFWTDDSFKSGEQAAESVLARL